MNSVCMATYNGVRFLGSQIESVLSQISPDDELIISDNGSIDGTWDYLVGLRDTRIRLFQCSEKGVLANFENSLSQARGELVFLCDQDDIWEAKRVEKAAAALITCDLVVCDGVVVSELGGVLQPSFYRLNGSAPGFLKNIIKNSYLGCCMAFRRSLLHRILPFPRDLPMHDWWIGLLGELTGKTVFLPDVLVRYRRHDSNASSTASRSRTPMTKKIVWRATLVLRLLQRLLRNP